MTSIDTETNRKLREMGVPCLVEALQAQDETHTLVVPFKERVKLAVDDARATSPTPRSRA